MRASHTYKHAIEKRKAVQTEKRGVVTDSAASCRPAAITTLQRVDHLTCTKLRRGKRFIVEKRKAVHMRPPRDLRHTHAAAAAVRPQYHAAADVVVVHAQNVTKTQWRKSTTHTATVPAKDASAMPSWLQSMLLTSPFWPDATECARRNSCTLG
jgi:hypothetical protein